MRIWPKQNYDEHSLKVPREPRGHSLALWTGEYRLVLTVFFIFIATMKWLGNRKGIWAV